MDSTQLKSTETNIKERYPELFKTRKVLRDLVHGYINLTEFDLEIIDTKYFQRLKDIRQLTCQHVYPGAKHTRFEHSLGVLELTRQAVVSLNRNGEFIANKDSKHKISPELEFNVSMAALLHDIGHCPFSHMGERQFDIKALRDEFSKELNEFNSKNGGRLFETTDVTYAVDVAKDRQQVTNHKSAHEIISCILVLKTFSDQLNKYASIIDFEFIIRCIMGVQYSYGAKGIENILIRLISSSALDMDKLDYIMRDTIYTGVSVPNIDTQRIFNNMFIDRDKIVFNSKSVPALQNLIEARDNLYMWVYNHHAVVYTDFLYYYILRRLSHNHKDIHSKEDDGGSKQDKAKTDYPVPFTVGCLTNDELFSLNAIEKDLVSDADVNYNLKRQYVLLMNSPTREFEPPDKKRIDRLKSLLVQLFERKLLKPWWKTIFEFNNFMTSNFPDDYLKSEIPKRICGSNKYISADEFRSQIAKAVIEKFKKPDEKAGEEATEGELYLEDGEFFIVERSNKFYSLDSIAKIMIYFKKNEVINNSVSDNDSEPSKEYYGKYLINVIPQRDYDKFFQKESFYIYIKLKKEPEEGDSQKVKEFYEKVEKEFIKVASFLGKMTPEEFEDYVRVQEAKGISK